MQSGYGVPEIQQFMVDTCCSSLLSISQDIGSSSQAQKHHQNQPPHHHQQHQEHQHYLQQRFHHFQPIPVTQQFFQHHQQQFPAFQSQQQQQTRRLHQQLGGLEQESGPENSNSTSGIVGAGGSPFIATNFNLEMNENSESREGLNDEDTVMRSEDGSDSRATVAVHRWQQQPPREQESDIKEPFWKPLDIEYMNRNNKRCKEKLETSNKYTKRPEEEKETNEGKSSGTNYGLFSELEAIYTRSRNNQAGSGSALTGDNNPAAAATAAGPAGYPRNNIDHGSETSTGEEASLKRLQKTKTKSKRKQLSSIAAFFENLVKQLMDHQESLHRKFIELMERRDQERTNREEAWRRKESARSNREAISRAQEQALASNKEAAIVSFLEKITGETIKLPDKEQFEDTQKDERPIARSETLNKTANVDNTTTRRWPKAEVQALIRVRSGLESRFQEPGLKGPLWEEVSTTMASLGYERSAKRCKEKWENINKYFRKTKYSAKKRPQHSKTCPYFHQLDQLYSKSHNPSLKPAATGIEPKDKSEFLDAIVVPVDQNNQQSRSLELVQEQLEMHRNFKFPELGSLRSNYTDNGNSNDASSITARKVLLQLRHENGHDNEEDEEEDEEGEEGEGENQEHLQDQCHKIELKEKHQIDGMF